MKKPKVVRKKPVAKATLIIENKALTERLEWGNRIIVLQQGEIDRLIKQVESLTGAISNMAKDN